MARSARSLVWFTSTVLVAGLVIAAGSAFTVEQLADAVAAAPVKVGWRPSYVASLPAVRATDLDIARSVPVAPAIATADAASAPTFTHEVAVDSLWVRARPTRLSAKVVALERGARLSVNRTDGNWALVTGPNGGQGWVYLEYLEAAAR